MTGPEYLEDLKQERLICSVWANVMLFTAIICMVSDMFIAASIALFVACISMISHGLVASKIKRMENS